MEKRREYAIQRLVDRPDWQALRKSLVGTWKKTPIGNVEKLRDWIGPIDRNTEWAKLRITLNYLTGSGFRTKMISLYVIDKLLGEVRKELWSRHGRIKCNCPIYCRFCGAKLKKDPVGHYCPSDNCQWRYGVDGCGD